MAKEINLKASARLVQQLGEQLISSELVALMELIKNSFDADATKVTVKIDNKIITNHGRGQIIIEDNGHGMVPSIIENAFYKLSTTHKLKHKMSLGFKRLSLGNKGLGRLSFQRLGYFIETVTRPNYSVFIENNLMEQKDFLAKEKYNEFQLTIDWSKLNEDLDLSDLVAPYDERFVENSCQGTYIRIDGLRNPEFWDLDNKNFNLLVEDIHSMTNPYIEKENKDIFKIKLYLNEQRIENSDFNEDTIKSLSRSNFAFNLNKDNIFKINIYYHPIFIKNYIDKVIKDLESQKFEIIENNYDISAYLEKEYSFDLSEKSKILISTNGNISVSTVQLSYVNNVFASPGNFHGKLYFLPWDSKSKESYMEYLASNNNLISTISQLNNLLQKIRGVNVFRNGFRVLPYGIDDWMGFNTLNRTVKFNPFGYNNMTGYVSIDGETSQNLREMTSREGFIKDEYGSNFLNLVQNLLLKIIVSDYDNLRSDFDYKILNSSEILSTKNGLIKFKKIPQADEVYEESLEESKRANENIKKVVNDMNIPDETKSKINEELNKARRANENLNTSYKATVDNQSQIIKLKDMENSQIQDILPMVGQSIIMESLTHELHRIKNNIESNALESIRELEKLEFPVKKEIDRRQRFILTDIKYLGEQLLHIEPTYKKRKTIIEEFNLKNYLIDMYVKDGPLQRKAEANKIKINILGNDLIIKANRGFITTVFDNLFLNSLHWVTANQNDRFINFEISNNGQVLVYDSGNGIDKSIENSIFEPFITKKIDGRGLGLYIVYSLLDQSKASIRLLDERKKENGNKFKFLITFTEFTNQTNLFNY